MTSNSVFHEIAGLFQAFSYIYAVFGYFVPPNGLSNFFGPRLDQDENNINIIRTVNMLFRNPYIRSVDIRDELGVSLPTANAILAELQGREVIREITGRSRNRTYLADGIMEILRGRAKTRSVPSHPLGSVGLK